MRLYVGGVHLGGDGYPNAAKTIELLIDGCNTNVIDLGKWLPAEIRLWSIARGSKLRFILFLIRLMGGNLMSFIKVCGAYFWKPAPVYLPYPSLFFLWLVSFLPLRLRPFCIADAYISIWDSMFVDRGYKRPHGLLSRCVRVMEARSLRAASVVLVDTEANKKMLVDTFGLQPDCVLSLPLAIEEQIFSRVQSAERERKQIITVLFVGTLIPLHGLSTLLEAVRILMADSKIEFRLVGDGQLSNVVESFVEKYKPERFFWLREWCSLKDIGCEISNADICLGVFGGIEKAARVLPFKLYMYLASGRAVVSQSMLSLPDGAPFPPILGVCPGDSEALARAIQKLAEDPDVRHRLASESKAYYVKWLSNASVIRIWKNEIFPRFYRSL